MAGTDHFSAVAQVYASSRPDYPAAMIDWLAQTAPARGLAWDAGCGNGQLAAPLADRFARVRATDISAAQIAEAATRPNLDYAVAPAHLSGLSDGSVDLATAAQAAHWFDMAAYCAEVRRVLRPGGLVALVSYGVMETSGDWGAVFERFYRETLSDCWPHERSHVETGYRDLYFPFEQVAAPALAIARDWALADLLAYCDTWSAVRALERAGRRAEFEDFAASLAEAWGRAEVRRRMVWPLALRVGRV